MHVLHVLPYLETGGTERHALTLVKSLQAQGLCSGEVLAPPGPFAGELEAAGVVWTPFSSFGDGAFRSWRTFEKAFRRLCQRASLVHVHAAPDLLWLASLCRSGRLPRVLTVHGFHGRGARISYYCAARLGNRFADAIICVSGSEEHLLLSGGASPHKLHRVYNGVADSASSTSAFLGEKSLSTVHIVFVGRLSPVKGVDVLVRALAIVNKAVRPELSVTLDIMGVGEEAPALQGLVEEHGLQDRVRFLGYRPDAAARLGTYDVVCLPSREDMCPLVCVEAMCHGKPVLATNVGGLPELVVDGKTGLLVPSDDVAALAKALLRLVTDHELRKRFGAAGRHRFESFFTQETMARKTWEIYERILNTAASSR